MLVNLCIRLLVANILILETIQLLNRKDGSQETRELDLFGSHNKLSSIFKYGVEVRIQSVKDDNSQSWVRISFGTIRYDEQLHQIRHPKSLKVHKKRKMYQQAQKWLQPDQKQKRNLNRGNLLARRPFH